jgi:hypothetical protein
MTTRVRNKRTHTPVPQTPPLAALSTMCTCCVLRGAVVFAQQPEHTSTQPTQASLSTPFTQPTNACTLQHAAPLNQPHAQHPQARPSTQPTQAPLSTPLYSTTCNHEHSTPTPSTHLQRHVVLRLLVQPVHVTCGELLYFCTATSILHTPLHSAACAAPASAHLQRHVVLRLLVQPVHVKCVELLY